MVSANQAKALCLIAKTLEDKPINWVLTGSMSFVLQGLAVTANDLDVQTDREGTYSIERLFKDFLTQPVRFSAAENIRSHFGKLELNGVTVELMGDIEKRLLDGTWESPVELEPHKRYISYENLSIPVLPLAYECEAYRKFGRLDKVKMLESWLKRG